MKKEPLVSVITPTFNRAHLIGETLDSVLAQTYQHWECIIVDDGSSDNTDEVVSEYVNKDPRFKYFHRPDEHMPGGNGARNYGFKMSQGEYVNWLDSDDLFSENKLKEQIIVALDTNADVIICKWGLFKNGNFKINEGLAVYKYKVDVLDFIEALYAEFGYMPNSTYLVKRTLLVKCFWNEYLRINQDALYFSNVFVLTKFIAYAGNTNVYYRQPQINNTSRLAKGDKKTSDLFHSLKIIESLYSIRFRENFPINFFNYKFKVYKRLSTLKGFKMTNDQKVFFSEQKKREKILRFKRLFDLKKAPKI